LENENNINEINIDNDYSSIIDLENAVVKLKICFLKNNIICKRRFSGKISDLDLGKEKQNNLKLRTE